MATAREYQSSKELCERRAKVASNEAVRQAWRNLAETYEALLMLDKMETPLALISGKRPE